ncbi:MAG: helix-turn-helix domain-containing protein [Gloeocapsa sp. UFS-A4-WI-NPMV-4B04]|jgi:DNA-binding XRE family transcriptional regulator|nr:helix-turn-helix domain-containing protein [Gloeocapsa sp. UFS-A4-WI-NPMV-4B04]
MTQNTTPKTTLWKSVRDSVLADPEVRAEYDALDNEFNVARAVIALRSQSGLTQRELAERIGIKQPQLARIESGKQLPKLETLALLADGAGYTIEVNFVPKARKKRSQKIKPIKVAPRELVNI